MVIRKTWKQHGISISSHCCKGGCLRMRTRSNNMRSELLRWCELYPGQSVVYSNEQNDYRKSPFCLQSVCKWLNRWFNSELDRIFLMYKYFSSATVLLPLLKWFCQTVECFSTTKYIHKLEILIDLNCSLV